MKRKRQLEFSGETSVDKDTPPLPSFPDEILEVHAKKARKESTPETGWKIITILSSGCYHLELFASDLDDELQMGSDDSARVTSQSTSTSTCSGTSKAKQGQLCT